MSIQLKLVVNALVFALIAIYMASRELYMMHPDAISIFNLTMPM